MKRTVNYITLLIFAPTLILTGVLGFLWSEGLTSGAPPYNLFHIIVGVFGLALVLSKKEDLIRGFNIGFGLIDLYQLLANILHWFPEEHFQWKTADDCLHRRIGAALGYDWIIWQKKGLTSSCSANSVSD